MVGGTCMVGDGGRIEHTQSLLEAIVETSIDGILVVDETREYVTWNQQFIEMWGVPEELIRDHPEEVGLEWALDQLEDPDAFIGKVEYLYEHPGEESRDEVHLTDGRVFDRYSSPVEADDGTHFGRVWFFRDISVQKERERALAEERDKYSTLVEQSHDAVVILQDEAFVFANEQCLEMLGYDEAELIGKPFVEITAPEDRERVRERYERRLDPERESPPPRYEAGYLTKDGTRRIAEISAASIQYEGRRAALVTIRDVTERKQYEEQLEQTREELEALNRLVRHDIRNDMSIVLGWAELLEEHVDEQGQEYLTTVLTSGEHILEITELARDYAELVTSGEEINVRPTSLRSVLQPELDLRRESFPEAEFVVVGEVPDVEVMANEMLGSVFRNLLNNAVQHNDSADPVVEVTCDVDDDDVLVRVADNGPGIPDTQKESLFGKGETGLDSAGTGIGLYLVRTLVDQYDGRVRVEDNDPEGAVFHVELPRAD